MGRWVSDKEYWEDGEPNPAVVILPRDLSDEMVDAALRSTAAFLDIKGSALTVNREKMRIRYRALIAAVEAQRNEPASSLMETAVGPESPAGQSQDPPAGRHELLEHMVRDALDAVGHLYGEDALAQVVQHMKRRNRAREHNAEIDALAKSIDCSL